MQGGWSKNVVIVAALVGAGFFGAWLRFRPHLGHAATWTDGDVTYQTTASDEVRHAVWERPLALAGGVNTPAREGRPALSPDGRWLVFAVGRPGLGMDLWIAELAGGRARDPRPLGALNTAGDDCAPAFGDGELVFASDRPGGAGGLDLWKTSFDDGLVGEPEVLGPPINGPADDTDPAPLRPGGRELVFCSDRAGRSSGGSADFDLYRARPADSGGAADAEPGFEVAPLDVLNSDVDEREPAFDRTGRTLVFARDGGPERGFDLWRSLRDRGAWLPAEPLSVLNTAEHERGPMPSADGFALYYARENASGDSDLWTARSRELFRVPGRPVGWIDALVLLALALVALLAWLAKRWETIDVLYRCVLASLIVHVLLLWWFRDLYPDHDELALGPGTERTFRVELASLAEARAAAERANAERAGAAERARERASAAGPRRAAPGPLEALERSTPEARPRTPSLAALASSRPSRPARSQAAPAPGPSAPAPAVELATREAFERLSGDARPVAVEAGTIARERRPAGASPRRRAETGATEPSTRPAPRAVARLEAPTPGRPDVVTSTRSTVRRPEAPSTTAGGAAERVELRADEAELERLAGVAAELELDPDLGGLERAREAGTSGPTRTHAPEFGETPAPASTPRATPFGPRTSTGARAPERRSVELGAPGRTSREFALADDEGLAEPPAESVTRMSDARDSATSSLEARATDRERSLARLAGPTRRSATRSPAPVERRASPGPAWGFAAGRERPSPRSSDRRPVERRLERSPGAADVALSDREPRATGSTSRAASPSARDAWAASPTSSLSPSLAARRGERSARSTIGPRRWIAAADRSEPRPLAREIAALERERGVAERAPFERTPYRARFGRQKDIALERFGGTVETERAVAAGLAYLASRQQRWGGWANRSERDDKYGQVAVGKSGLALLAFLGAGHTPASGTTYSDVVARAVAWLLDTQDGRTGHFGDSSAYSHGIATYALAECHALTEDPMLRAPLERAVAQILRHQVDRGPRDPRTGGWGYFYPSGRRFDDWPRVSVTAWQVMALESARIGGLAVPDEAFDDARAFLVGSFDRQRGWMRYSHDPERLRSSVPTLPGSTPAGLFALSLLGEDLDAVRWRPLRRFVAERAPSRYRSRSEDAFLERAEGNLYFWYYGTLAEFRAGGAAWKRWNSAMQDTLLAAQAADGSWEPRSIYAVRFAGDTERDRIYSTALCVLSLEVYYRYFTPLLSVR